jgi:LPXTG-site transpeptidase (sortase) family protein
MFLYRKAKRRDTLYKAKITFKKNFLPPIIGIVAMVVVVGMLNIQWIYAQIQYDLSNSSIGNYAISGSSVVNANETNEVIIPKLNVKAPIIYGVSPYNEEQIQTKLRDGVVHYNTTAKPGKIGNTVIFGHSSGQLWSSGHYKYIFTLLDKLQKGDKVYVDYEGVRYIYEVTGNKTILPTDFTVLQQPSGTSMLSLITCTPVGINKYRLVVMAKQISPKPGTTYTVPKLTSEQKANYWKKVIESADRQSLSKPF